MSYGKILLVAAPVALSLLTAPMAHAEWGHRGGGWGHEGGYRGGYYHGGGPGWAGAALLGLGAAAVIGSVIAAQPYYAAPPAYYAPQPQPYYAPQQYYAPRPYYAAPYTPAPY